MAYVTAIMTSFQSVDSVNIMARGRAISSAVDVVEVIKRSFINDITIDDIKTAILNGELLEDYANDPRGHSCLMVGTVEDGRPLHIVLTILAEIEEVLIITVYVPIPPKWIDPCTRAQRELTDEPENV